MGKPALPALLRSLQAHDPERRRGAAAALGEMGRDADEAVPALLSLVNDPLNSVRISGIQALGRIRSRPRESLGALATAITDTDAEVRIEAARAAARFGQEAVEWLPHMKDSLVHEPVRWSLLPVLVLSDPEKASDVWGEMKNLLPEWGDSERHEIVREALSAFRECPDAARTAFPLLFEGLLFKNAPTREAFQTVLDGIDAWGADVDPLWADALKQAGPTWRFERAAGHFRRHPDALPAQRVDVAELLRGELSKEEPSSLVFRCLMTLLVDSGREVDPALYLSVFRSPSKGLFGEDAYYAALSGLTRGGPKALAALLDFRVPDPVEDGSIINPEAKTRQARILLALAARDIVRTLQEEEAEVYRKRMASHRNRYMKIAADPGKWVASEGGKGIRRRSWTAGSLEVERISVDVTFPDSPDFRALEYVPGLEIWVALSREGTLLFLKPRPDGSLVATDIFDLESLSHEAFPPPLQSDGEWGCLTVSTSGEFLAVGGEENSGEEEKLSRILLFRAGCPKPLAAGRFPIRKLEELHLDERSNTIAALDYWSKVVWIRYDLSPVPKMEIVAEKEGGFCCQVAGTLLSDGETFVVTTHHGGLAAIHPERPLRPIFFPAEENRPQLARALPEDSLIFKMMNDAVVTRLDAVTGNNIWSSTIPSNPGKYALYRCAATEKYWAVYGADGIVLGRSSTGEILAYLPLANKDDCEVTASGDDRQNNRVLAFNPEGSEFVLAAWRCEEKSEYMDPRPMLIRFRIREKE